MSIIAFADELLTSQEVATLFRVDSQTVVRWARNGRLPAIQTPGGRLRFRESDVQAALQTSAADVGAEAVA